MLISRWRSQEHTLLLNRLNMLTNKVAVETKIRDASLSISRLYTSKRLSRQADDQIETANRKVEAATAELNRIAKRESDVRTRILRHMAAVLGLMLRRVETSTNGAQLQATLTPLPVGSDRDLLSPRTPFSPAFSTSTSSTSRGVTKFEGPHLYAGHKDATFPMQRSPVASPQMPAGLFSSMPPSSNGHESAMARAPSTHSTALNYLSSSTTALDSQIAELTSQLEAAQLASREQEAAVKALTEQRDAALRRLEESEREERENRSTQKREIELQEELKDARSLLDRAEARVRQQEQEIFKREEGTKRLQADYEQDQTDMLEKLRSTLELHSDGQLGHLMPDTARLSTSIFVSRYLPDLLNHVGTEHERALQENEHLREQVQQFEQASSSLNSRSEEEIKGYKRQLEIQQQEKQVLLKKISRIEGENLDLKKSIQALEKEVEEQTRLANNGAEESERNIQEAQAFFSQRLQAAEQALAAKTQEGEQEKRSLRGRLENLQGDLQQIRADKVAMGDSLKGIWQRLPTDAALQNRLALQDSDDASRYKAAYAPRQDADRTSFSLERFALRLGNFISSADKLFERFSLQEEQMSTHRNTAEQAQNLLERSQADLQRAESQRQELNQRMEAVQRKEADLLRHANELQTALDTNRAAAKRSESSIRELESRCAALEQEKLALKGNQADKARLSAMEKELDDVREELATAQDELDEVKSKESRQRIQMLDELTTLTEEASSLRTQLRAAQRKLTAAGKS